jgi:hypothetical protein
VAGGPKGAPVFLRLVHGAGTPPDDGAPASEEAGRTMKPRNGFAPIDRS